MRASLPNLSILSAALLLAGCAAAPWTKPGVDQATASRDAAECQALVYQGTAGLTGAAAGARAAIIEADCMRGRGYARTRS